MAMGVATEVIDMQMELLGAVDKTINANPAKMREDALLYTMMQHAEMMADDPNAQSDAAVQLRGMMQDGSVDEAFGYINERSAEEGINVDDMIRRGDDLRSRAEEGRAAKSGPGPQMNPMAEGVQQGVQEQQGGPAPLMGG